MRVSRAVIVDFAACRLTIERDRVEARFHADGSISVLDIAAIIGKPDHIEATRHCGYGDDQRRMAVEHELGHAFVAEVLGQPHSWSVWGDAHGKPSGTPWTPRVTEEECRVVGLQRYLNTCELDEHGNLLRTWGEKVADVATRFGILIETVKREER
jgi:hypothetical protein